VLRQFLKELARSHLSPAIGTKQNALTVNVTVKLNLRGGNSRLFKRLLAPPTIEWE
jgi:hypothetical protein